MQEEKIFKDVTIDGKLVQYKKPEQLKANDYQNYHQETFIGYTGLLLILLIGLLIAKQ